MIDLASDSENWDLYTMNGDLALVKNADCYAQHVAQRLKGYLGEWFLDLSWGVPWFQSILIKNPNPNVIDGVLKETIIDSPGIVELLDFSLDYDALTRDLDVDWAARSIDGEVSSTTTIG